jgi:hypothetical protein
MTGPKANPEYSSISFHVSSIFRLLRLIEWSLRAEICRMKPVLLLLYSLSLLHRFGESEISDGVAEKPRPYQCKIKG